jgi:hypothetical protein
MMPRSRREWKLLLNGEQQQQQRSKLGRGQWRLGVLVGVLGLLLHRQCAGSTTRW